MVSRSPPVSHDDTAAAVPFGRSPSWSKRLASLGMGRVHILAWRDLDDPEAGGSELHAHRIASLWASAGLDVTMRTSSAEGHPSSTERDGYRVVRKSGRYAVFPGARSPARSGGTDATTGGSRSGTACLSSPRSGRQGPRVVFLHHVHAEMWQMTLPPNLAQVGQVRGAALAPPLYRRTRLVTLSDSSRDRDRVDAEDATRAGERRAARRGGPRFCTGRRAFGSHPLVVAVGRLVPGQAIRRAHGRARQGEGGPPGPARRHRRRGLRARAARGQASRARRRRLARHAGKAHRRRAGRRLQARLGARQRVAARGMGDDGHRGRRLRDSGRRHPDRRPRGRRRATA